MLGLVLDPRSKSPAYRQIVEQVRSMVSTGVMPSGTVLPTVRQLALHLGVSRLTAHKAYQELQRIGIVTAKTRRGTIVCPIFEEEVGLDRLVAFLKTGPFPEFERICERTNVRSMASPVPDPRLFDSDEYLASMGELRNRGSWAYYYPDSVSDPGLSAAFCQFAETFGLGFSADNTVTMGGVQPWFPALLCALVPEGSTILIQEPHTLNPTNAYAIRGLDPAGVTTGDEGLDVDLLKTQCKRLRPAALVAQPNFGFGDGVRWTDQNRRDVAGVLQHYGVKLIERTAFSILAFDSHRPGLVSHLMPEDLGFAEFGFQACLAPGLLVSFANVRGAERQTVVQSIARHGLTLPKPERLTCSDFIKRGALSSNVQRTTRELQKRRDALMRALESSLPNSCRCTMPQGGLSACVVLPRKLDAEDLFRRALDKRIAVMPCRYLSSGGSGDDRVVLSYSMLPAPALEEAGAVFGRLIHTLL